VEFGDEREVSTEGVLSPPYVPDVTGALQLIGEEIIERSADG